MATHSGKTVIWDLGNTLLKADMISFAREIGLLDFMLYPLLDRKNPKKIYELAFDLLHQIESAPHPCYPLATAQGKPLPALICHWFSGTISHKELTLKIESFLDRYPFSSARQKRLIFQTLRILLDPEKFTRCMKPIKQTTMLLKETAQHLPQHQLYVLSNWDAHSFEHLMKAHPTVFQHFSPENIAISGHLGTIKPHASIYQKFLAQYGLDAKTCIFIDDQIENIQAAEKEGITGIFLKDENYEDLRNQLWKLLVVP